MEKIRSEVRAICEKALRGGGLRKVLLVPPDASRPQYLGAMTAMFYEIFSAAGVRVDVLPALGTHAPMGRAALAGYFGKIPPERFLVHRWRDGVTKIGEVPVDFVRSVMGEFCRDDADDAAVAAVGALFPRSINVEVSDYLLDPSYDAIFSIGQVVPHEVAGMANYTKNIAVGCGGADFINASHMVGAAYGIERTQGRTDTPVRRLFDYTEERFLAKLPLTYVLTVAQGGDAVGVFSGRGRGVFEQAAALSSACNITRLGAPVVFCVAELGEGTHSAWLGNKAIYRTRMAIADGGSLLILAPGITRFGEDAENDRLIRKYGYCGRGQVLRLCAREADLQANLSVAAHLIHGSADGRFTVTYAAPQLGRAAVEGAGFEYMEWEAALVRREAAERGEGFYVENPALGLWCA